MKPLFSFISLLTILFMATLGFGQGCVFNIAGDWETTVPGTASSNLYHFGPNGIVSVFSLVGPKRELARAAYKLDNAEAPKTIEFKRMRGADVFPSGAAAIEVARRCTSSGSRARGSPPSGSHQQAPPPPPGPPPRRRQPPPPPVLRTRGHASPQGRACLWNVAQERRRQNRG